MSGLVKAKKYDIKDSNIALLGSDLEKNVRKNAAEKEEAWQGIGKQLGLEIWRIEKFKVVPWPKEQYGQFYSGDSYIVLHTYKKKPDDKKFSFDVHFWLGAETSQDEAGTAAYKTVELDDYLGGDPVQHREVMGYESELFLSYFPKFQTQEGGVDSGFKQVKPEEYRHRLFHVKGKGNKVIVREVPKTVESLNSGDVFVLDAGLQLFQFNGKEANGMERHKGSEFINALAQERKGLAKSLVMTEGDQDMEKFFDALGSRGKIKSASEGGEDGKLETPPKRLFQLSDASGKLEFTEISTGVVRKSMFKTDDVFIFDTGREVVAWIGKGATAQEKRMSLQYAQNYLVKYNRPPQMPISRVLEGSENDYFQQALDPEEYKGYVPKKVNPAGKDAAPVPGVQHK